MHQHSQGIHSLLPVCREEKGSNLPSLHHQVETWEADPLHCLGQGTFWGAVRTQGRRHSEHYWGHHRGSWESKSKFCRDSKSHRVCPDTHWQGFWAGTWESLKNSQRANENGRVRPGRKKLNFRVHQQNYSTLFQKLFCWHGGWLILAARPRVTDQGARHFHSNSKLRLSDLNHSQNTSKRHWINGIQQRWHDERWVCFGSGQHQGKQLWSAYGLSFQGQGNGWKDCACNLKLQRSRCKSPGHWVH